MRKVLSVKPHVKRTVRFADRLALYVITLSLMTGIVNAQTESQIVNARIETRQATQSLDREIQSVADRGVAAWVAYRVTTIRGPQHMCAGNSRSSRRVMLEPATELTVLVRVENRQIERLHAVTPDCEVDAGELPVVSLTGVTSADSAGWLTAQATSAEPRGQREARIVQPAISALIWHVGDAPLKTVIALARSDRRTSIRSQALFWLAQRAGNEAVMAIRDAAESDPETEVKKRAVFALSQLPKDEGIPLLIQVARTHRNPEVRRQAMFWLGQSKDARAATFFEEILK